jgi:hypothetical protein
MLYPLQVLSQCVRAGLHPRVTRHSAPEPMHAGWCSACGAAVGTSGEGWCASTNIPCRSTVSTSLLFALRTCRDTVLDILLANAAASHGSRHIAVDCALRITDDSVRTHTHPVTPTPRGRVGAPEIWASVLGKDGGVGTTKAAERIVTAVITHRIHRGRIEIGFGCGFAPLMGSLSPRRSCLGRVCRTCDCHKVSVHRFHRISKRAEPTASAPPPSGCAGDADAEGEERRRMSAGGRRPAVWWAAAVTVATLGPRCKPRGEPRYWGPPQRLVGC